MAQENEVNGLNQSSDLCQQYLRIYIIWIIFEK